MLSTERRASRRFPVHYKLYFRTLHKRKPTPYGSGQTLTISSSGVSFTSDLTLSVGTLLELLIQWPVQRGRALSLDAGRNWASSPFGAAPNSAPSP